jgi:hypothetical protein
MYNYYSFSLDTKDPDGNYESKFMEMVHSVSLDGASPFETEPSNIQ